MQDLVIVTDAWHPQINGVVRSIEKTVEELERQGVIVTMITPQLFASVPCPTYPEIRLSLARPGWIAAMLADRPEAYVHIATEGPLGLAARRACRKAGRPFTTCYHTRFPDYVAARLPVPVGLLHAYARWFHNAGAGCMVATESLERELSGRGVRRLMRWSRGIDRRLFRPREKSPLPFGLPRPLFVTIGRVAVEKNLEAFLALDLPGSKLVVGDGPARESLAARHPEAHFVGAHTGEALARFYAEADVFVFPSRSDTFGNTILEALSSGVPVAAFPVPGPLDIIGRNHPAGVLSEDLRSACLAALDASPEAAESLAATYCWEAATRQFLDNVVEAHRVLEVVPRGTAATGASPPSFGFADISPSRGEMGASLQGRRLADLPP